jgi:radical SAM superfamily enzyme YgiQ (UPF0313 family)
LSNEKHQSERLGSDGSPKRLIRLISPRFPALNIFSQLSIPPLGLIYVGTAAQRTGRYDVEIIDENNTKHDDHVALQKERPADVVGFYCGLSSTMPRVFELVKQYGDMGVLTLAGGGHVDALPEEALRNGIDVVFRGEAEESFIEVLDSHFDNGDFANIDGIAYKGSDGIPHLKERREKPVDLSTLPEPDFSLIKDMRRPVKFLPLSRTRGCNFRCEFCSVNQRFGSYRSISPEKTLVHVEHLVANGHRLFFFVDDNFAQDREGTLELCKGITGLMKKYKCELEFTLQVRAEVARDPLMMEAIKEAGGKVLCIGIESPIQEELLNMKKGQKASEVEANLRALRRNGFFIHGMFIFSYPSKLGTGIGHNLTLVERANRYIGFVKRARIDTLQVLKAVPVPGSDLAKRLKEEGRIYPLEEVGWDKYDGNFLTYQPDPGDNAIEVQEQATRIMRAFYSPWNIAKLIYLGPFAPFDWVFYFIRRGAQKVRGRCLAFEERYCKPCPPVRQWGEFMSEGLQGARREIYRLWRNTMIRIGGSFILREWNRKVKLEGFTQKLREQQERIINALPEYKKMRKHKGSS